MRKIKAKIPYKVFTLITFLYAIYLVLQRTMIENDPFRMNILLGGFFLLGALWVLVSARMMGSRHSFVYLTLWIPVFFFFTYCILL